MVVEKLKQDSEAGLRMFKFRLIQESQISDDV